MAASEATKTEPNSLLSDSKRLAMLTLSPSAVRPRSRPPPTRPSTAGPRWMPYAHSQRLGQGGVEFRIEPLDDLQHRPDGQKSISTASLRCGGRAKQRHNAVAQELVDHASMTPDRLLHDFEVAVEEKHGVKGIKALGKSREPAQVGEHDRDALLDPPAISILPRRGRGCSRLDQRAVILLDSRPD